MEFLTHVLSSTLILISSVFGIVGDQPANVVSATTSDSVELGIVELSPNGPAGGYAMPASNDSRCGVGDADECPDTGGGGSTHPDLRANTPVETHTTYANVDAEFNGTVYNTGATTNEDFDFYFELDLDSNGSIDDTSIHFTQAGGLASGQYTSTKTANFGKLPIGTHRVRLVSETVTDEENTDNNTSAWRSFTVPEGADCNLRAYESESDSTPQTQFELGTEIWFRWSPDPDGGPAYLKRNITPPSVDTGSQRFEPTPDYNSPLLSEGYYTYYWDYPGYDCSIDITIGDPEPDPDPDPTATLQACDLGGGGCSSGTKNIDPGEEIQLTWSSTNAVSCSFANFDGNGGQAKNGTDTSITEPSAGNSLIYRVICVNADNVSVSDIVTVHTNSSSGEQCDGETLSARPTIIRKGDSSELTWMPPTDAGFACTITGSNINGSDTTVDVSSEAASCEGGTVTVTPQSTSDYTLTCDGVEEGEATVRVLPVFQET